MSKKEMTGEAKRNLKVIALVFGLALISGAWMIMSATKSSAIAGIDKSSIPEITTDPIDKPIGSGKNVNSEQLDELNRQKDAEDAKAAAARGETYVPKVVSGEKEEVKPEAPIAQAASAPIIVTAPVPQIGAPLPQIQERNNAPSGMKAAMLGTLVETIKPFESESGKTTTFSKPVDAAGATLATSTPAVKPCPIDATCNSSGKMMLASAGSKAFVQLEMSIMTDEPSPVFGRLIAGGNPALRSRSIMGSYVQNPNLTVSIVFNKLSLKDGTIPVNAVVIDSETGRTAMAGKVDHKFLTRFGLPMIAAAAGEFAQLTAQAGSTVATGVGTMVQTSTLNSAQIGRAAVAAGVKGAGTVLTAQAAASKPSTELQNNIGVEIRFLDDVWVPIP